MIDDSAPSLSPTAALDPLRVLVVDDNAINRDFLRGALAERVAELRFAASGHEALDQLADHRFDLVLMDLHMPDLDGISTWKLACDRYGGRVPARVIAVTADSRPEERRRLKEAGFDGLLAKPVGVQTLLRGMTRVCGGLDGFEAPTSTPVQRARLLDDERAQRANGSHESTMFMRDAFATQLDEERFELDRMLSNGQDLEAAELLHQWKGACGYVGATRLEHACDELEQSLRHGLDSSPGGRYTHLFRTLEATLAVLRPDAGPKACRQV